MDLKRSLSYKFYKDSEIEYLKNLIKMPIKTERRDCLTDERQSQTEHKERINTITPR